MLFCMRAVGMPARAGKINDSKQALEHQTCTSAGLGQRMNEGHAAGEIKGRPRRDVTCSQEEAKRETSWWWDGGFDSKADEDESEIFPVARERRDFRRAQTRLALRQTPSDRPYRSSQPRTCDHLRPPPRRSHRLSGAAGHQASTARRRADRSSVEEVKKRKAGAGPNPLPRPRSAAKATQEVVVKTKRAGGHVPRGSERPSRSDPRPQSAPNRPRRDASNKYSAVENWVGEKEGGAGPASRPTVTRQGYTQRTRATRKRPCPWMAGDDLSAGRT